MGAATLPSWIRRGETDPAHVFIFHRVASDFWLIIGLVLLVFGGRLHLFGLSWWIDSRARASYS
jgi:hypothetical protein